MQILRLEGTSAMKQYNKGGLSDVSCENLALTIYAGKFINPLYFIMHTVSDFNEKNGDKSSSWMKLGLF